MRRASNTVDAKCAFCDQKAYYDIPTYLRSWGYTCLECAILFGGPGWQRLGTIIADLPETNQERERPL